MTQLLRPSEAQLQSAAAHAARCVARAVPPITQEQVDIFSMRAAGLRDKAIAEKRGYTRSMVKDRIKAAVSALGTRTSAEALVILVRAGLL